MRSGLTSRTVLLALAVAVITDGLRLAVDLRSGGLLGAGSTDDGVYYAASASLLAGRLPYRDFLFLHPPGVLLALTPFAAIGRIAGDPAGFAAARLGCVLLGGVNAGLVSIVLRNRGWAAALAGSTVYACSWPIVFAERSALLEPIGCTATLGAIALVGVSEGRRRRIGAGLLLGTAIAVKLTFAPLALVLVLALRRKALPAVIAAATTLLVVCLPFLISAPVAMTREVLADQLGRRRIVPLIGVRLAAITVPPAIPGVSAQVALAVVLALCALLVVVGARTVGARRYAVMAVVEFALLLTAPSFYGHYAVLALLPLSLLAGVAVSRLLMTPPLRSRRGPVTAIALALVLVAVVAPWTPDRIGKLSTAAEPAALVAAVQSGPGCVTADAATTLALTGALTRDLKTGCPVWPDVTGWQYDPGGSTRSPDAPWPDADPAYQRRVGGYLASGSVLALTWKKDGLSRATRAALLAGRPLYRGRGLEVRLTSRTKADASGGRMP